ncbi:hypothetical protein [Sinorhizobium meliloti]|uniref:hypothetical protein n=1 Tax=Rhizobium meliloti TaxID=382 RepID=UPI000FDC2089|nr:hypothetical protein [Sinorhizobium meliloti]RVL15848.1 hypothetical protein CN149_05250 [Sinorhizobium meliloti]
MDRLSVIIGLLGLVFALFPPANSRWIFAAALLCIAWSLWRLIGTPALLQVARVARGRIPLRWVIPFVANHPGASKADVLDHVIELARSGRLTIYGERYGSSRLVSIEAQHFKEHGLFSGLGLLQTNEMDPYDRYFNLHIDFSSIGTLCKAAQQQT